MLAVKLLGQFDVRRDGRPLVISSRSAQSLLAFLLVNTGVTHRREKLAGLLWPNTPEDNARRNLRQELWRLRKALEPGPSTDGVVPYLQSDDISITFNVNSAYWLDAAVLERAGAEETSADDLQNALAVYRGELLPGFYDEWVVLERERLRSVYEHKMAQLLERLQAERRWAQVQEWSEHWIALGHSPEVAYRALMVAHSASGDMSRVAAVYQRCIETLRSDLDIGPSEKTRTLYEKLKSGEYGGMGVSENLSPTQPLTQPHPSEFAEVPPYKGLHYFDVTDSDLFFGRDRLTAALAGRLREHHLLAVVGASGSGKSSLVRAGLISALKSGKRLADGMLPPVGSNHWTIYVFTPTAHPLEALAVALTRDAESLTVTTGLMDDMRRDTRGLRIYCHKPMSASSTSGEESQLLLVIDQFEELFTLCREEAERKAFIDNLLVATAPELDRPVRVVLTLRADFYAHCAQYVNLRDALSQRQEYIGALNAYELRRAIEGPAQHGEWTFEEGLVELILRDVGTEPGSLPLLSHALLETWQRRHARMLTLAGYTASGGVRGAITRTAERVYQELPAEQQAIARNILLRLTELGEGTQDTRRRVSSSELVMGADTATVGQVLKKLADARLVTVGADQVEVAHEALIREWPRLREWLNQNRDGRRMHRHLTEAAQAWDKLNRDEGELYRGARLAQTLEGVKAIVGELNPLEQQFLNVSEHLQVRQDAEREAQRQRDLRAAQKLAEVERQRAEAETQRAQAELRRAQTERSRAEEQVGANRKLRQRAVFLAGALLVAAVLAAAAIILAQQSNQNAQRADDERRIAFARELSVNAVYNLDIDPERSILLALQAIATSSAGGKPVLREAEEALHRAVMASRIQLTLRGHTDGVNDVAYSPDGKRLITGSSDKTAKIWDAASGKELFTLSGHTDQVFAVAYSPDGTRVATASYDKSAKVWDTNSGKELLTLSGHTDQVWDVAFSPDGRRIATAGADKTAKIWDAATGKELLTLAGHTDLIRGLAFSPDSTRLYTGSYDKTAKAWDAATGKELLTFAGHTSAVWSVAISPDGNRLATGGFEGTAKIWDTASGRQLSSLTLSGVGSGVAFNQAGTRLATCGGNGVTTVWDIATGQSVLDLRGHTASVPACAFSRDSQGTHLATVSRDLTAKVWDISPSGARDWLTLAGHSGRVHDVAYSPDGKYIASASADKTAKVWDAATGAELLTLAHAGWVRAVAFSPDGKRLATAADDLTAKVWDLSTGQVLLTLPDGPPMQGLRDRGVSFSPDGKRLALTSDGNTAKVWDATSGQELLTLSGHTMLIQTVAFSPDGRRIATASQDKTAKVWDAATGNELLTLSGHNGAIWDLAFSRDGARIVTSGADGTAKAWDAVTGKLLLTLSGHSGVVLDVAFSPDGTQIATGSGDRTVKIWNVVPSGGPGEQPLTLYGASAQVFGIAYSPDGKRLAVASTDGIVRVYALPLEDIIAIAKSRLTRTWTLDECQKYLHVEQCPAEPQVGDNP